MVKSCGWVGGVGGPCDYCVTPVPIGLGFLFLTGLGLVLGLGRLDLGLELDYKKVNHVVHALQVFLKLTSNFKM